MNERRERKHYVYLITDVMTDEIYIGVRSCAGDPFKDTYMGSGTILKEKLKDPNKKYFLRKTILGIFEERSIALAVETLLVNANFVNRNDTMNLKLGGEFASQNYSRQMEGIARAKAEGKFKGRVPTARAKQPEIQKLAVTGMRPTEIARQLGISRASVYRYI